MRFLPILLALLATAASAQTRQYELVVPPSDFEVGCFGPCDCAVEVRPTYGGFDLVPTGFDGLYDTYRVEHYIVSFNNGPGAVMLTGDGTFRIGGEFAYVQQMTLDLADYTGRRFHVDSGLVPVRAAFPKIDIACAAHAYACYDTVVRVGAAPVGTVGVSPGTAPAILAVAPNPFTGTTSIRLALDPAHPVRVAVFDAAGRVVRELPSREVLTWDGNRDTGAPAPAGAYWLRAGTATRMLIKLR